MKDIRTLIEGQTSTDELVETLLESTNPEPTYEGSTPLILKVFSSSRNAWKGVIVFHGSTYRVHAGRFGPQKLVPKLIVPFDVGRGEWKWKAVKEAKDMQLDESN